MRTIHKYPLAILESQSISTHQGADVIYAGLDQEDTPCVWVRHDTSRPELIVKISVYGTGHDVSYFPEKHVGSFVYRAGFFHVFAS